MKHESAPGTPLYPSPEGLRQPLRVVLVVPRKVPEWVRAFRALATGYEWLDLVTLVVSDAALPKLTGVPASLRAFVAFERLLLGATRSLTPVPVPHDADSGIEGETTEEELTARVDATHADLVIALVQFSMASELAVHAPLGCWYLDASLIDERYAGLSLLTPMVRRETATQMALMLQESGKAPVDLAASWGKTRGTSFLKQREDAFRKLPSLLLRGLHRLAAGYVSTERHLVCALQLRSQPSIGRAAGLRALVSITRASPRWLMAWRRNGRIGWTLVLRLGGALLDPDAPVIGSHALLKAPKGWWGDPFVIAADGRKFVFVEEMAEPKQKKAHIACVELVAGGARQLGIALDEPGHLSFPQVFHWQGQWYLTVESAYDQRVSLYRATQFPLGWVRVCDLLNGRVCVDPTLYHHEGRWYLFANVAENGINTCDELFLFVADRLEGPYLPHPASPIVCDVRRARMAGQLFLRDGRLIRPSQDCGPGYGNAVVFNEVLELGPTVYRERQLARLAPQLARMVDGCHTYNVDGAIEVLDILGRPPSGTAFMHVFDAGIARDQVSFSTRPAAVSPVPVPRGDESAHPGGSSR